VDETSRQHEVMASRDHLLTATPEALQQLAGKHSQDAKLRAA